MGSKGERLRDLREALRLTQQAVADQLQLSPKSISNIEAGRVDLTDRNITALSEAYGVSPEWLRTGRGPMFGQQGRPNLAAVLEAANLSELERAIVDGFFRVPAKQRRALFELFAATFAEYGITSLDKFREALGGETAPKPQGTTIQPPRRIRVPAERVPYAAKVGSAMDNDELLDWATRAGLREEDDDKG